MMISLGWDWLHRRLRRCFLSKVGGTAKEELASEPTSGGIDDSHHAFELVAGEALVVLFLFELLAVFAALRLSPLVLGLDQPALLTGTQLGFAVGHNEVLAKWVNAYALTTSSS